MAEFQRSMDVTSQIPGDRYVRVGMCQDTSPFKMSLKSVEP